MRRNRPLVFEPLEERLCLDSGAVPTQYPGSPILLPTGGAWTAHSPFYGSPIFADLKGDGHNELIVEAAGGKLIAYGTNSLGQLVKFREYDTTPMANGVQGNFKSTPVVVNVPGIGAVIVAALGHDESKLGTDEDGRVYAWNAVTGAVLPGWPQSTSLPPPNLFGQTGVTGPLTVGYLEGNGMPDIIVDSFSTMVTAFRINGTKLWQYNNDDTVEPGAVVADLYGDGKQEVIFDSGISPSIYYQAGGFITILNQDGSLNRRIPIGNAFFGSPIVVDLFGDGRKEIIAAPESHFESATGLTFTAAQDAAFRAAANRVYAFFPDGTPVPGWPYHTTSNDNLEEGTWKEPVAADLYGNGQTEILDIDRLGVLHVILPKGQDAPGFVGGKKLNPGFVDFFSSPIVADVTGQGSQDIVVSADFVITAFDNKGNQIFSTTTSSVSPPGGAPNTIEDAAAYGQFDPNGPPVLAFSTNSGKAPNEPQAVVIYRLPATTTPPAWPMLRRTAAGQAVLLSTKAEATFTTKAYEALFLRPPTPAELAYYVPLLTSQALSQFDLATKLAEAPGGVKNFPGLLNGTDAQTIAKVTPIYAALGIPLTADSRAAILYDAHRGRSFDAVASLIVGSSTGASLIVGSSTGAGGYAATNSVASWAASIFRDIYNVEATPAQIASIVQAVDGGESLVNVVKGLLNSTDARKGYVISQIAHYLGRAATASDLSLSNYTRRENVVIAIVASPEFYVKAGNSLASFVNAAYNDIVGFIPNAATNASWVSRISKRTATRATLATELVEGQMYYHTFVFNNMFKLIPDPSKGVLPFQLDDPGVVINPNPTVLNSYTAQLLGGTTEEAVLASMMTTSQYLSNSSYYRGIYVSYGIRE